MDLLSVLSVLSGPVVFSVVLSKRSKRGGHEKTGSQGPRVLVSL